MADIKIIMHKNDIPKGLSLGTELAIDTETMGLNLVRDRLCLLQMKGNESSDIHLVQFVDRKLDAPNLRELLGRKDILKIFHFARFDIVAIYMYLGVLCENIFCTKIASKLARTYSQKHGLQELVKEFLLIDLKKEQQSSYWGAKELSEQQKIYAATDVIYLHEIKDKLNMILLNENRYNLAKSCFDFLPTKAILDTLKWDDDNDIFKH